ncbi:Protein RER1, partial [Nakaseomyces glabratus]
ISQVLNGWRIGCTLEDYKIEPDEMLSSKPDATLDHNDHKYKKLYRLCLAKSTAYTKLRWVVELSLVVLFLSRFKPLPDCYVYDGKWFDDLYCFLSGCTYGFVNDKVLQQYNEYLDVGEKPDVFHPILSRPSEFKFWHYCIRTTVYYILWELLVSQCRPLFWPLAFVLHSTYCLAYVFKVFLQSENPTHQFYLDVCKRHTMARWISGIGLLSFVLFLYRCHCAWELCYYALGISILDAFIMCLTRMHDIYSQQPKDNSQEENEASMEFRPYLRNSPEFILWCICIKHTVWFLVLSLFEVRYDQEDIVVFIFFYDVYWTVICVIKAILLMNSYGTYQHRYVNEMRWLQDTMALDGVLKCPPWM